MCIGSVDPRPVGPDACGASVQSVPKHGKQQRVAACTFLARAKVQASASISGTDGAAPVGSSAIRPASSATLAAVGAIQRVSAPRQVRRGPEGAASNIAVGGWIEQMTEALREPQTAGARSGPRPNDSARRRRRETVAAEVVALSTAA